VNDRGAHFRSPLFNELAQLLVLYERVRIEAFAATIASEEVRAVGAPGGSCGAQDTFRRCMFAQSEFAEALHRLSQTDEYRTTESEVDAEFEMKNLFAMISNASRYFQAHHAPAHPVQVGVAGPAAAPEFAATSAEEALSIIWEGFAQATQAMHALVAAFICDRF
jgi:hypothetical protein